MKPLTLSNLVSVDFVLFSANTEFTWQNRKYEIFKSGKLNSSIVITQIPAIKQNRRI
jgi:hypothetical protein